MVVTGASGYLGPYVVEALAARREGCVGVYHRTPPGGRVLDSVRADLTSPSGADSVIREMQPKAVIHCAAANPGSPDEVMDAVNHRGTDLVARASALVGSRLVVVSTDIVFDGQHAPYADNAPAAPTSVYGRTKAAGERAALARCPTAAIVRTSLIYALDRIDRGTAGFLRRIEGAEDLVLFADVIRQPVHAPALADALVRLALDDVQVAGTLNVAGAQAVSRAEFGRRLIDRWGGDALAVKDAPVAEVLGPGHGVPIDLRLSLDRARALGYSLPGLDAVVPAAG